MEFIAGAVIVCALVLLIFRAALGPTALSELRANRRHAYVLMVGLTALVTPPDLRNMAGLMVASLACFEANLLLRR